MIGMTFWKFGRAHRNSLDRLNKRHFTKKIIKNLGFQTACKAGSVGSESFPDLRYIVS